MNDILRLIKRFIPTRLFRMGQPLYHFGLALTSALLYRFPSRRLKVVGVTGTKGKSTTAEIVNTILEEAGYTTAVLGTIRFKIADVEEKNLYKMTIPGRFFVQRFLRRAVNAGCEWVVLELTSEGAKQFRHRFVSLDALIFTNLSPEHIESHGSYEKYRDAKLSIARTLSRSRKRSRFIVANADDTEHERFFRAAGSATPVPFSLTDGEPYELCERDVSLTFDGLSMRAGIPGEFNLYNILAAASFARVVGISTEVIARAVQTLRRVRGRVEFVEEAREHGFDVVVDYAHTIDSLQQFYDIFRENRNICVLGNTGGGRDKWKRPKMARVAGEHCEEMVLTNEDPYDEDPREILEQMAEGVVDTSKLTIIMDRREAIAHALKRATVLARQNGGARAAVLITGKGTDPYIMVANGRKILWDDATVVREEIAHLAKSADAL